MYKRQVRERAQADRNSHTRFHQWYQSMSGLLAGWLDDWDFKQFKGLDCTYTSMYNRAVSFEWDPIKAAANVRKHGVRFSEALGVFSDDYAITLHDDESDPNEQRFVTLGVGIKGRVLVVVYCYRGENLRIISARTAGRLERENYETQL